jgi:hypothetical protein
MILKQARRGIAAGVGAVAIGVLAVACSSGTAVTPISAGATSIAGFSFQVPTVQLPFSGPVLVKPAVATTQTTTQVQDQLRGVTHSGEGCPLSLAGN